MKVIPRLSTPVEAATVLRISKHALASWRAQKRGPSPTKQGSRVFYREDLLAEYIERKHA